MEDAWWRECVRYVQSSMEDAIGALYVAETFAGESKRMVRLFGCIQIVDVWDLDDTSCHLLKGQRPHSEDPDGVCGDTGGVELDGCSIKGEGQREGTGRSRGRHSHLSSNEMSRRDVVVHLCFRPWRSKNTSAIQTTSLKRTTRSLTKSTVP